MAKENRTWGYDRIVGAEPLGEIGKSVIEECLSKIILLSARCGELWAEYVADHHAEPNHQGKSNVLLFPLVSGNHSEVPCNVASVSVGFCVSTIELLRQWVGKSRTISVKAV